MALRVTYPKSKYPSLASRFIAGYGAPAAGVYGSSPVQVQPQTITLAPTIPTIRNAVVTPDTPTDPPPTGGDPGNTPPPSARPPVAKPPPPATPPPGTTTTTSWQDDPILKQIYALSKQSEQDAEDTALSLRKQLLIRHGSKEIASKLLPGDQGTAETAAANQFSTLAQLLHGHDQRVRGLENQLNSANLFYGGERGNQLSLEGRMYIGEQKTADETLATQLSDIAANLLGAHNAAREKRVNAEGDARGRHPDVPVVTPATPVTPVVPPVAPVVTPLMPEPPRVAAPVTAGPPIWQGDVPIPTGPTTAVLPAYGGGTAGVPLPRTSVPTTDWLRKLLLG